ncbi:alpha/beta hydrolase [Maricaulaceae bacterium MS644]
MGVTGMGAASSQSASETAHPGRNAGADEQSDMFSFDGWAGPALPVWTYTPDPADTGLPLVIVMSGQGRNASEYRDQWIDAARTHRFAIAAPEFARTDFPAASHYNLGNRVDAEGRAVAPALWSFSAIEPMFDAARARLGLTCQTYAIYGHSAGAQFVHRYLVFSAAPRVHAAVSANAGWYTRPDFDIAWPFGLGGTGLGGADLARWLARPMTVLLGSADTAQTGSLNQTQAAMAQGPHRLARGRSFMEAGLAAAEALGAPLNWRLGYVPGVGHDNSLMAEHAAHDLVTRPSTP